MKTSGARWKSPGAIRFPIDAAAASAAPGREKKLRYGRSRDEPAIFILFSHARSDYRLVCTSPSPFATSRQARARAGDDEIK